MSSDTPIQADPYLSSKEAGRLLGYTHDYISKLCREGKMSGIQRGRVWYVTEEEARAFQARHEAELEQKKAQLSEKFSAIRQQHESQRVQETPVQTASEPEVAIAPVAKPDPIMEAAPVYSEPVFASAAEGIKETSALAYGQSTAPIAAASEEDTTDEPIQKTIQFTMPKHFAAVAVLALLMLAPSLMSGITSRVDRYVPGTGTVSPLVDNLDEGVASVIEAQSELARRTANTFGFVQYLDDGYWELVVSTTELCKDFYRFLSLISNSYLTVYTMQGEMIYHSIGEIKGTGAVVLQGYELLGRSLVVGSQNVLDSYKGIFMVDSYIETLKKK